MLFRAQLPSVVSTFQQLVQDPRMQILLGNNEDSQAEASHRAQERMQEQVSLVREHVKKLPTVKIGPV